MSSRYLAKILILFASLFAAALVDRGVTLACTAADAVKMSKTHDEVGGQMMEGAKPGSPGVSLAENAQSGSGDSAAAEQIFAERCAACHGADGSGKGPAAASLKPAPVNFHDAKWQKSVSDDNIAKAIVEGGAAVGLSNQMAPNPDLEDQPGVVKALVARVRGFGK
jgi:mono/diheme cytochrome c family protein